MLKVLSAVIGLAGLGCFGLAVRTYTKPDAPQLTALVPKELPAAVTNSTNLYRSNNMTLAEASYFWTANELDFREIATIWREIEPPEPPQRPVRPSFRHEEIEAFFVEFVESRPVVKGKRRTLIVKLLKMLDDEGACPSVVKKDDLKDLEPEGKLDREVFKKLASLPLWQHTLTVARKYTAKFNQAAMLPDSLIVSLSHDLGKIPAYYDKYCKSGDHAMISVHILNTISDYTSLRNYDELDRIIRGHHLLKTDFPLTEMLKQADQDARKEEHAAFMQAELAGEVYPPKGGQGNDPDGAAAASRWRN